MLAELFIRNFAIIEELRLQLAPGLNILTGETGAGKSIILDAMALVLGDRADTTMIRSGCDRTEVEATFRYDRRAHPGLHSELTEQGLEHEEGDILVLAREIRSNGRSVSRVNGRAVNLALLRTLGEDLVDVHGQGDHLSLLKPRSHLPLLDAYGGLEAERKSVSEAVSRLRAVRRELETLVRNERAMSQRLDMLKFQIEEIDAARLKAGEEEELRAERNRAANVEKLLQYSSAALTLIDGSDGEDSGVVDRLGQAERELSLLSRMDGSAAKVLEYLQGIIFQLSEVSAELIDYTGQLEFDPERLDFLEERLELIGRLKRKYGDDVASVLAMRDRAAEELKNISDSEARVDELRGEEERLLATIGQLALQLSRRRQLVAEQLAADVEKELADLNMGMARFSVSAEHTADEKGAYVGDQRLRFDETGIDRVEFLVSANPGEELKPLAKVASGGETSRLMLAMKTALARADATPTLIFDEIDQGIGGRVGDVVGRKLWGLTVPAGHQVIVVTHLPQLAGYADGHFNVSKQVSAGRTVTTVNLLDQEGRVRELAAMLGTSGEYATGGAGAILELARRNKSAAGSQAT